VTGGAGFIGSAFGNRALTNREIVGAPETLMTTVADISVMIVCALACDNLARATGFTPQTTFETGLLRTVAWYRQHADWTRRVKSGEYREYYERNYGSRDVPNLLSVHAQ